MSPSSIPRYALDRANDAADILDIGGSFSTKPCLSAYVCGVGLFTAGAGYFDGYFAGVGGGGLGIRRHYLCAVGLILYSYEQSAWGPADTEGWDTISGRHVGLLAQFIPPEQRGTGFS